jgi:glycosyltransferase involved in cell wall biosynthesis
LPSYYEPFGLVVPESLACGTPVIVSAHVGAKDLLCDDYGVVMSAVGVNAIKQAIELASQRQFTVPLDFAKRHNLTVEAHINKLKKIMASAGAW